MFKAIFTASVAVAAMLVMSGCSTIEVAKASSFNGQKVVTSGTAVSHISTTTHGLYFLTFPLITGSTEKWGLFTFLEDTVSSTAVASAVAAEAAKQKGTKVIDLNTSCSGAGLLFKYKYASASATVVK